VVPFGMSTGDGLQANNPILLVLKLEKFIVLRVHCLPLSRFMSVVLEPDLQPCNLRLTAGPSGRAVKGVGLRPLAC
jgi:hypothetical protein